MAFMWRLPLKPDEALKQVKTTQPFDEAFRKYAPARKLCTTGKGYKNWVPAVESGGEEICFFAGLTLPSIARKCLASYQLAGDCYLYGFCSSDPICEQCLTNPSTKPTLGDTQTSLESTVAVPSTKMTIPQNAQIEWDEFQSTTKELVPDSYNSRLCNTPLESKKVDLQLSPSPPLAVPVPDIPDTGSRPQASQGDAVLVGFIGNNNYHDVALQAASEILPPDEKDTEEDNCTACKEEAMNCTTCKEEAMRKEERKNNEGKADIDKETVTMAQINREEGCKAIAITVEEGEITLSVQREDDE
jgi:hypothetical protein